jgi:UDP-glucose 4-epimerase
MVNILLTGGAGYIGSHILGQLLEKQFKVLVVDNLSTGSRKLVNKKAKFFKIDICDKKKLEKVFKHKISCIIHMAAALNVPESQKNPRKYYFNNVFGTQNILDLAVKYKVKKFILSSTCAVYGGVKGKVSENSPLMPESNYGKTKLLAEQLTKSYAKKSSFKYAILRYFNVVGADPLLKTGPINKGSLFKNITLCLSKKNPKIDLFGTNYQTNDGTAIRDYIDVNDLSNLHLESLDKLKKSESFILNCGYGKPLSVKKIITSFQKIAKKKIKIQKKNKRPGDVEKVYSDIKLLKKILPKWKSQYSLSDSIKLSLAWEKKINEKN